MSHILLLVHGKVTVRANPVYLDRDIRSVIMSMSTIICLILLRERYSSSPELLEPGTTQCLRSLSLKLNYGTSTKGVTNLQRNI